MPGGLTKLSLIMVPPTSIKYPDWNYDQWDTMVRRPWSRRLQFLGIPKKELSRDTDCKAAAKFNQECERVKPEKYTLLGSVWREGQ
jgi:hypothetical protein